MNKQELIQQKIGFVFVNGAGMKGEVWSKVADGMSQPSLLVDFPLREGTVEARKELALADYVSHLRKQVNEWGVRRFIIVAHSLGGVLALRLAYEFSDRLAGFVAVGAAIPSKGGSFLSVLPFPKRMLLSAILPKMGTKPPESAIRSGLCNDLTPAQTAEIVSGFIPESLRVYTDRVDAPIPDVPKLYVKLSLDKEFGLSLQNKMVSALSPQFVQSLETGHLPMLSDPDGLRRLLQDFYIQVDI
ncbi:alpha/beta fold hydrolase [Paenibacillus sp. PL91]|uniref:alpha/beta fold hydrolase n=1 Tax=Paenibacillus sp. PL91 TaxID=2729538 RepID=UPI00145D9D7B|nr:alpha/beta hydrolase [Paenibacillus sp. PL91]MBC9203807.1 alpha/beta hydrolase [Paenibacillus sp. PL91]